MAGSRLRPPHGAAGVPRGMNGGGDDAAVYSETFSAYAELARSPAAPRSGRQCLAAFGACSCCVCVLEPRIGDDDPWHPDKFGDATSVHMQQVRRAKRRALSRQLSRSDVRRDNTRRDFRDDATAPTDDPRPRAGDPRAMLAGYSADLVTGVVDDDAATQGAPTSRQHRWWLRLHRASCAVCAAHERAFRVTTGAAPPHAAPGCYGRWMCHALRTGFDPLFCAEREPVQIPNHEPVYAEWPATLKYMSAIETDVPGAFSAHTWRRPEFIAPLLTIIRPQHRERAARDGTIPKARVCLDPKAGLLNEALLDWSFVYEEVSSSVRLIMQPRLWCAKLDICKMFLQLAASPALQRHLYFSDPRHEPRWGGKGPPHASWAKPARHPRYCHFTRLIFGIKVIPAFANMLSGEVARYLRMLGCTGVTFLTDDYFIVSAARDECARWMAVALQVLTLLGLPSPPAKNEGPCRMLEFLGVVVDSRGELRSSWARLDRALTDLSRIVADGSVEAAELRRVTGVLQWICKYVRGGNAFLRSSWNMIATADHDWQVLRVTEAFRADAAWWRYGITRRLLSGSRMFLHGDFVRQELFKSDGSGSGRFGFWRCTADDLGLLVWGALPQHANHHVPYVEMFAIWAACMMFAHQWSGLMIIFGCDSAPVCYAANKESSPDRALLLLQQYISALQAVFRFDYVVEHVTRLENGLADIVTRCSAPQEIAPFLAPEGFSAAAAAGTPLRCRWSSPLATGPLLALPLGRRRRSR